MKSQDLFFQVNQRVCSWNRLTSSHPLLFPWIQPHSTMDSDRRQWNRGEAREKGGKETGWFTPEWSVHAASREILIQEPCGGVYATLMAYSTQGGGRGEDRAAEGSSLKGVAAIKIPIKVNQYHHIFNPFHSHPHFNFLQASFQGPKFIKPASHWLYDKTWPFWKGFWVWTLREQRDRDTVH